jgi:2-aminoethylphosphonate-pyruvate transaminase
MKDLGFKQLLSDDLQAPIIITFMQPKNVNFNFEKFYNALSKKNFLIYPGKLTVADTFRIGCIGNLDEYDMYNAIKSIKEVLTELQIKIK